MNIFKSFIKNDNFKASGFYLIGNLFDKAIVFLTVPIFTRMMSTNDYGIVNTYLSWVSILSLIVGLSLGNSIRSAYIEYKDDINGYISSILFLSLLNFILTSIIIIGFVKIFAKNIDYMLVVLCLVQSFMSFIINTISIKYMMGIEFIKRTLLLALPNIVITIISIIFISNMSKEKYLGRILAYVLVFTIIGMIYFIRCIIIGKKLISKEYWKYAISLSLPLIFHGLCMNILATSDRTIITIFKGASEAGIYSLVYNFSMIATVVVSSLESVWIPWFNNRIKNNEKNVINQKVNLYIKIVMMVMIIILLLSPEILIIMAPQEYWKGKFLIPPIILASFFMFLYSISVNLEYYYKSTKVIAINTIIAAIINLILNIIFIPKYGAIAAAYTTTIAYFISFIIHYIAARKIDNLLFPFKIYIKPILIMLIMVICVYITMNNMWIRIFILLPIIIVYILKDVKEISRIALKMNK